MSDYRFVGEEEANVKKIIQEKNLLAKKIDKRTIKDDNRGNITIKSKINVPIIMRLFKKFIIKNVATAVSQSL